jgi:hypothetical protein
MMRISTDGSVHHERMADHVKTRGSSVIGSNGQEASGAPVMIKKSPMKWQAPVWARFLPGVSKVMKVWLDESRFRNILPPSSGQRVNQANNQRTKLNGCLHGLPFNSEDGAICSSDMLTNC